jgi:hypothetical protein
MLIEFSFLAISAIVYPILKDNLLMRHLFMSSGFLLCHEKITPQISQEKGVPTKDEKNLRR